MRFGTLRASHRDKESHSMKLRNSVASHELAVR